MSYVIEIVKNIKTVGQLKEVLEDLWDGLELEFISDNEFLSEDEGCMIQIIGNKHQKPVAIEFVYYDEE